MTKKYKHTDSTIGVKQTRINAKSDSKTLESVNPENTNVSDEVTSRINSYVEQDVGSRVKNIAKSTVIEATRQSGRLAKTAFDAEEISDKNSPIYNSSPYDNNKQQERYQSSTTRRNDNSRNSRHNNHVEINNESTRSSERTNLTENKKVEVEYKVTGIKQTKINASSQSSMSEQFVNKNSRYESSTNRKENSRNIRNKESTTQLNNNSTRESDRVNNNQFSDDKKENSGKIKSTKINASSKTANFEQFNSNSNRYNNRYQSSTNRVTRVHRDNTKTIVNLNATRTSEMSSKSGIKELDEKKVKSEYIKKLQINVKTRNLQDSTAGKTLILGRETEILKKVKGNKVNNANLRVHIRKESGAFSVREKKAVSRTNYRKVKGQKFTPVSFGKIYRTNDNIASSVVRRNVKSRFSIQKLSGNIEWLDKGKYAKHFERARLGMISIGINRRRRKLKNAEKIWQKRKERRRLQRSLISTPAVSGRVAWDDVKAQLRGGEVNVVTGDTGNKARNFLVKKAKEPLSFIKGKYKKERIAHKKSLYRQKLKRKQDRMKAIYGEKKRINKTLKNKKGYDRFKTKFLEMRKFKKANRYRLVDRVVDGIKNFFINGVTFIKRIAMKAVAGAGFFLLGAIIIILPVMVMAGVLGGKASKEHMAEEQVLVAQAGEMMKLHSKFTNYEANIKSKYPGYDKYEVEVGDVGFNPHELLAYLSIKYGDEELNEKMEADIKSIFDEMYEEQITERTETKTEVDSEGNKKEIKIKVLSAKVVRKKTVGQIAKERLPKENPDDKKVLEWYDDIVKNKGGHPNLFEGAEIIGGNVNYKFAGNVGGGSGSLYGQFDPSKSDFGNTPPDPTYRAGDNAYPAGQCTDYVHNRRSQIGKPMPHSYMQNGGQWGASARAAGMSVDHSPRAGDAVSFPPGVAGADATFGHIAFVEKVNSDGSIEISEANVVGLGVISFRTLPASVTPYCDFIH